MITFGIVLVAVVAWIAVGHAPGKRAAAWQFESSRRHWQYSAAGNPQYGRGPATFAYLGCLLLGPLALLFGLACSVVGRSVPALVKAQTDAKRAELAQVQRDIDDAHRQLGIALIKRDAS